LVGKSKAVAGLAEGVRASLRKKQKDINWSVVAAATKAFTENEIFALVSLGMPLDALVALARHRDWRPAQLGSLANRAEFNWKKDPAVSPALVKAGAKASAQIKRGEWA
jgi:hypothetical protein